MSQTNNIRAPAEDDYIYCIRCGLCLSVCPVYRLTLNETDAPRARVALLRAVREGLVEEPDEETSRQFFRCLLCGSCTFACPSGVAVDRILELTRGEMANLGLQPQPLVVLGSHIYEHHNISGESNENRMVWADNLPIPPLGLGKEQADVVYFVGCVSALFPRSYSVAQSMVQVMERAGVDYGLLGEEEWCCGYPVAISGEPDQARETMRHNLDAVRALGAKTLVTTCPSCFHFWKHTYPTALGEALGFEVKHATEFLTDLVKGGQLPFKEGLPDRVVTYHDPCDLGRKGGVFEAPREVLAHIPGVTLVEMVENQGGSHCCGGGGNLESVDPELSKAVAARRIQQAAETGATIVLSACQQCERTLAQAARAERVRIRVKDVSELVLEALE